MLLSLEVAPAARGSHMRSSILFVGFSKFHRSGVLTWFNYFSGYSTPGEEEKDLAYAATRLCNEVCQRRQRFRVRTLQLPWEHLPSCFPNVTKHLFQTTSDFGCFVFPHLACKGQRRKVRIQILLLRKLLESGRCISDRGEVVGHGQILSRRHHILHGTNLIWERASLLSIEKARQKQNRTWALLNSKTVKSTFDQWVWKFCKTHCCHCRHWSNALVHGSMGSFRRTTTVGTILRCCLARSFGELDGAFVSWRNWRIKALLLWELKGLI